MAEELKRREVIDPSVAEIMEGVEKKQSEARLSRGARSKKRKEREKGEARLPRRVNWDLPPELKNWIVDFAEHERIPTSQVASFLLIEALDRLQMEAGQRRKELDEHLNEVLQPCKVPSDSPRYDWNLDFSKKG